MDVEEECKTPFHVIKVAKTAVNQKDNKILDEMSKFEETDFNHVIFQLTHIQDTLQSLLGHFTRHQSHVA